MILTELAP